MKALRSACRALLQYHQHRIPVGAFVEVTVEELVENVRIQMTHHVEPKHHAVVLVPLAEIERGERSALAALDDALDRCVAMLFEAEDGLE